MPVWKETGRGLGNTGVAARCDMILRDNKMEKVPCRDTAAPMKATAEPLANSGALQTLHTSSNH